VGLRASERWRAWAVGDDQQDLCPDATAAAGIEDGAEVAARA
jgi:hypothetical protein